MYGTPLQMATFLASVAQLVDVEPTDTWTNLHVRRAAREMAGKLHERLAAAKGERS